MSADWPVVPLRDVMSLDLDKVAIEPSAQYDMVGVYSFGRGLFRKEPVSGSNTSYKTFYRLKSDHVVMSQLFGWEGALALSSHEFDGLFVSPMFPTFHCNTSRLDRRFLGWLMRQPKFWQDLGKRAKGMGDRRRTLNPSSLLDTLITLPPYSEQQRIVTRIEELAGKIARARGLRQETGGMVEQVKVAEERRIWPDTALKNAPTLCDVTTFLTRGRHSQQGESKHFLIKTQHVQMGKYVWTNMTLDADVATNIAPVAVARPGDILIACSAAGCLGRVALYDDPERTASTDTHIAIARADQTHVLPEYLYAYLLGAQGQHQLRSRERGDWKREKVGFRLTELNLRDLERVPVPLPSKEEQKCIVDYLNSLQSKVYALKNLQQQTQAELDALLPSLLDRAFRGEL